MQRAAGRHGPRGGRGQGKLTSRLAWETRYPTQADRAYGDDVARWLADKGKASDDLSEPKPIYDDLRPIWQAWHDLHSSRPIAGGLTPMPLALPWSELSRYCEDHGLRGESRRRWIRLLRAMDTAYLVVVAEGRAARRATRGNP